MKLVITIDPTVLSGLAAAGADATVELTLSLGADQQSARFEAAHPTGPLAPLLREGLLAPGTRLYFDQPRVNRSGMATVQADGTLVVDGKLQAFRSPSKAASAVTGSVINGWTLWQRADGRTLDSLRNELNQTDE